MKTLRPQWRFRQGHCFLWETPCQPWKLSLMLPGTLFFPIHPSRQKKVWKSYSNIGPLAWILSRRPYGVQPLVASHWMRIPVIKSLAIKRLKSRANLLAGTTVPDTSEAGRWHESIAHGLGTFLNHKWYECKTITLGKHAWWAFFVHRETSWTPRREGVVH